MKFIRPTVISPSMLLSSNVPETDYPAWTSGTYAVGDRRIVLAQHKVYQCAVAGTSTISPELDPTRWLLVGPTNRWAMMDGQVGTVTSQSDSITLTIKPGRFNSIALLNVNASTLSITMTAGGDTVYTKSIDLDSGVTVGNWYEYFYEPIAQQDTVALTDLLDAALFDLPAYMEGELTVTLTRVGETVSCGVLVVGMAFDVGRTLLAPSVSIRDFSRKEADDYGNYVIVERGYSKRMTANVLVETPRADEVVRNISRYRATNMVWIGHVNHGSLIVFGFASDWKLVFENAFVSEFSLEVEGMT